MHRIIFALKKAHLGGVGFAKGFLGAVPHMTPARYDLLYVLRMDGNVARGRMLEQSEIRRILGLHPSTVSKMISRLVVIGWLAKKRRGRMNTIHLTSEGFAAIELARRIVEKRRTVRWWFDANFRPDRRGWRSAHSEITIFSERVDSLGAELGRTASHIYPLPYILDD